MDREGMLRGIGIPSGRGHFAVELGVEDVRCREHRRFHCTWRDHQDTVNRQDEKVRALIWCVCAEHVGEERGARKKGFCWASNATSRAVIPRLERLSEEVEHGDTEVDEGVLDSEDQERNVFRETRQLRRQRHAHRCPTSKENREHLRTRLQYTS